MLLSFGSTSNKQQQHEGKSFVSSIFLCVFEMYPNFVPSFSVLVFLPYEKTVQCCDIGSRHGLSLTKKCYLWTSDVIWKSNSCQGQYHPS